MTLSPRKIHRAPWACAFALGLALGGCASVPPPTSELAAAEAALSAAQSLQPRGHAADALQEAFGLFEAAQSNLDRGRNDLALQLAQQAQASAELAQARARLAAAQDDVDSKAARNADQRRAELRDGEL